MKILLTLLTVALLFGCDPYRRIAGDTDRKPHQRAILLSEAAREAPVPLSTFKPGDTLTESRANKEYI